MKNKMLAMLSVVTTLAVAAPALAYYTVVYCPWPYRLAVTYGYFVDAWGYLRYGSYYVCI